MTDPIRVKQLDRAWVEQASPREVADALASGCLAELLGGTPPVDIEATAVRDGYLAEAAKARAEAEQLRRAPAPAPGQGSDRGQQPQGDYREQANARLATMTPQQIAEAHTRHEWDDLLGIKK